MAYALTNSRNNAHVPCMRLIDNVQQERCAMVTIVSTQKCVFSLTCAIFISIISFILLCSFIHSLLTFFFFYYCFPLHRSAFD